MDNFFIDLVNMSITASWLVIAVILLRLVLKKAPKSISVALWAIVALRLIFPFSIESVLSLIPSARTVPKEIVFAKEPTIDSGVDSINSIVNPIITEAFAPTSELTSINPIQVHLAIAEFLWLVGMVAMSAYALISYLRIAHRIREAVCIGKNIYSCDRVPSPFILGIIRPRIILPSKMDEDDKKYVIAHENAHIKRCDHLWKPLGFLLLTVYWFNPLLWIAYILLCRDIELACDEKVICNMDGDDKKAYSTALLNCSIQKRIITACPLAFGEVGVKKRIKTVLNYKKPTFWVIVIAIIATLAVAVGFLTNPKKEDYDDLPDITAHAYEVEDVVYTAPYLSFLYFPGHNTPLFSVTDDQKLLRKEADNTSGNWDMLGRLREITLGKYNFDVYFEDFQNIAFKNDLSPKKLRENNTNAWSLTDDNTVFVLQQKDGNVYIALGTTKIHYVFKLTSNINEDMGIIAVSGKNSVPVKIFSTDDSLEYIKNQINWLDISYSNDSFTPFDIYCDGNTQLGWFSIYNASTFERLDFFSPSGLSPHTYIFGNAIDGGKYIITMRLEYDIESGGDALLCFGANLPGVPIVGAWEAPTTVLGIENASQSSVTTYVFNQDRTGYRIDTFSENTHFSYTCINGLLTLTFKGDKEMTEAFSYECDGKSLILTDAEHHRSITLSKATYAEIDVPPIEKQPSGKNSMRFFSHQGITGEPREISNVSFGFKKNANFSVATGHNFDYLDNLVLSDTDSESYILSFSIYQDVLPYVNSLFSLLNSIVTVDYEGNVMYDKNTNPNDCVKITINGIPATITEVSMGAGNGHRDFYFTFHAEEYTEFKDITEFEFTVNQVQK